MGAAFDRLVPRKRTVTNVVRSPHPVAIFTAGAVDLVYGQGLAGYSGRRRIGEASSAFSKFSGDLGPQQFFQGAGSLLPTRSADRRGFNQALPNTHGPAAQPNLVLDLIGRNSDPFTHNN